MVVRARNKMDQKDIRPGIYRHFKGKEYKVLGVVIHSETREKLVLYLELYPPYELNVRPIELFTELVDKPEYNYKGPRFTLVKELNNLVL